MTVIVFGRMNPPHLGHGRLIEKALNHAKEKGKNVKVFLTQTHNVNNPLNFETKRNVLKKMYGNQINVEPAKSLFTVIGYNPGENINLFVGPNRQVAFKEAANKYRKNGKMTLINTELKRGKNTGNFLNEVSATKLRNAIRKNENFSKYLNKKVLENKNLINRIVSQVKNPPTPKPKSAKKALSVKRPLSPKKSPSRKSARLRTV